MLQMKCARDALKEEFATFSLTTTQNRKMELEFFLIPESKFLKAE